MKLLAEAEQMKVTVALEKMGVKANSGANRAFNIVDTSANHSSNAKLRSKLFSVA